MKKAIHILIPFFLLWSTWTFAQDTFSIVAVDEATGEIGSAGASCISGAAQFGGVILISEIVPGRGAVNGQATVCIPHINLTNAITQMEAGLSPQEILDWLYNNDACQFGTPEERQYGIVDFDGNGAPRSASFTGSGALDHAGQRVGANYAIQGNILLGPQILDSMEYNFVNTNGSLAEKLMAALQGANVPGADSRCLDAGTSSTSSFLQVYKPDDEASTPYLRINVMESPAGVEPIDSVQMLFDQWLSTSTEAPLDELEISIFPNPIAGHLNIKTKRAEEPLELKIFDLTGKLLWRQKITTERTSIRSDFMPQTGMVFYQFQNENGVIKKSGKLLVQ